MALGVNMQAFDAYMVDSAMGYKFANFYEKACGYIDYCRRTIGPDIWIEYTNLCERWQKCPPGHFHIGKHCVTRRCKAS